jgi:hypothetical protein
MEKTVTYCDLCGKPDRFIGVNWRRAVLCVLMLPAVVLVAAMVMFLLEVGTRG